MADCLFVSQDMIDKWLLAGRIDFRGSVMSITGDSQSYDLNPAVRFTRIVGADTDQAGMLSTVRTLEEVEAAGGEHYHDSVVLGDVAYEVQNGFFARPRPITSDGAAAPGAAGDEDSEIAARPSDRPRAQPGAATGREEASASDEKGQRQEEELASFLLENLR